jgi:hypothetical protein
LVYFMAMSSTLRPFRTFFGHMVHFSHFGMLYQENLLCQP